MNTLRNAITSRCLQSGADFRVVQGSLGDVDVSTRMIYEHATWVACVPSRQCDLFALLPTPAPLDAQR